MSRLAASALGLWVRRNIAWLVVFGAAVAQAVRPWFTGANFTTQQWIGVAGMAVTAFLAYVVPNIETGVAAYAKPVAILFLAGLNAFYQVWPGGISRPDVWTILTALGAAVASLLPSTQPRSVLAGGSHYLGDTL